MMRLAIAWVTATLLISGNSPALAADFSPACAHEQSRQLDFFLGRWNVAWSMSNGQSGTARNEIVLENGGCVLREHFVDTNGVIEGTGLYSWFAPASKWVFMWMDSQGISVMAMGGVPDDGSGAFALTPQRGADPNRQYRMIFSDVTEETFTWKYQSRAGETAAWEDETVSRYTRQP